MIKRYNNVSMAWGAPGIIFQIAGSVLYNNQLMFNLGTIFIIVGFAFYAKAKGRSTAWCLLGFLSIFGLIFLALLKDNSHEKTECLHCAEIIQKNAVLCEDRQSTIAVVKSSQLDELQKRNQIISKYGITTEEYDIFVKFKELKLKQPDLSTKIIMLRIEEDSNYTSAYIKTALNKIKKVSTNKQKAETN